jgi:predicted ester cyclase
VGQEEGVMAIDIKDVARRTLTEIMPNGDIAALAKVVHPDCVNHEAPPGTQGGFEGMKQTMLWLREVFSDLRWEIHKVVGEGDMVAVYCTLHGRHTGELMGVAPTNRPVAFRQVHLVRFEDGRSIEHWAVRDDLTLMRQLGVVHAKPSSTGVPS